MASSRIARASSLLALQWSRSLLMGWAYRVLVGTIGVGYAFGAMLYSGMLYVPAHPLNIPFFFYVEPRGPGGVGAYPAILAGGPYVQVDLPMIGTILMTLIAAGVGLGMALAVLLILRLIHDRKSGLLASTAGRSALGITPAMFALVTLGACCSTTAAATAGLSLAARWGGGTATSLLGNTWYLGLIQLSVVYGALLAQEYLVRVYDLLAGSSATRLSAAGTAASRAPQNP
ncbi:MAG: hypothetical protein WCA77_00630 [Thermoplasmata archaeon]